MVEIPDAQVDALRRASREVGEALARARGRSPEFYFHGLPSWLAFLPLPLAALHRDDEELWTEIAKQNGMSLDDWKVPDVFEPR